VSDVLKIEVGLPDPCLSPNGDKHHWAKVGRAKKKLRDAVYNTIRFTKPEFVNACWDGAVVDYDFYTTVRRNRDDDNFTSMMKSGRDALGPPTKGRKHVHPGATVVVNDTVIRNGEVRFHIDKYNPRVVITLTRTA